MADFSGGELINFEKEIGAAVGIPAHEIQFNTGQFISELTTFIMRGIDNGAGSYPTYHYWIVQGLPDNDGSETTAPNGGPLTDIVIVAIF